MITKYGMEITSNMLEQYLDRLIGRVFKLLPLWEENKEYFANNQTSLVQELCGGESLILYCGFYIELINKLQALSEIDEHKYIKKHVRECIDIIYTLKKKVGEWEIGSIG